MKSSATAILLAALLLASPACAGDRAASDPNGPDPNRSTASKTPSTDAGAPAAAGAAGSPAGKTPSVPSDPNATVARVNGAAITARNYEEAIHEYLQGQGAPPDLPDEQMKVVRQMVMEALIGTELVYQKSVADGVKVDPNQIDQAVAEAQKPFGGDREKWEASLKLQGLDRDSFVDTVRRNLAINQEIQAKVFDKIAVTDADAKAYYDQHPKEMQKPEEVRASHILIRVPDGANDEAKKAAKAKAGEALEKVKKGADFAAVAKEMSQDTGSASQGGDLGFFAKGKMVPAFESSAFSLKVGQISDVVESPFGYHVIKVTDHHDAVTASFDEVQERLKGFLKQRQARTDVQAYLKTLRDAAKVEIL